MLTLQKNSLKFKLSLGIYSFLTRILCPLVKLKALRRGRMEPGYLIALNERFGYFDDSSLSAVNQFGSGVIWIHAVSLGETKAAQILIEAIQDHLGKRSPNLPRTTLTKFLLTHSTATGRAAGEEFIKAIGLQESEVLQVWYPWDTPGAVGRFLDKFKPKLGLLMETEVWPNMVLTCSQQNIPLVLVNARLSKKSFDGAASLGYFARGIYQSLTAAISQNPEDSNHLTALGTNVIGTVGNIKFDAVVNSDQLNDGKAFALKFENLTSKPIVMFASSRAEEEALLFQALIANKALQEGVQWLIVPRHPQRFDEIVRVGLQLGFTFSRRVKPLLGTNGESYFENNQSISQLLPNIWMGDTLGEMNLYFGMSKVALLGGSFEPLGGQNLIEAAACGCPVVMGPHVFNFAQAAEQSKQHGAAVQCEDLQSACVRAHKIALNKAEQSQMSQVAVEFAQDNKGAIVKTVELLSPYF
jgi:3-deoxy-D-manno-octulosonic-acid transferase